MNDKVSVEVKWKDCFRSMSGDFAVVNVFNFKDGHTEVDGAVLGKAPLPAGAKDAAWAFMIRLKQMINAVPQESARLDLAKQVLLEIFSALEEEYPDAFDEDEDDGVDVSDAISDLEKALNALKEGKSGGDH